MEIGRKEELCFWQNSKSMERLKKEQVNFFVVCDFVGVKKKASYRFNHTGMGK
jgi:hypothetical protein